MFFLFGYVQGEEFKLEEVEATKVLEEFRGQGISEKYSLIFDLRHIPREGKESYYRGQLWGNWKGGEISTLIDLQPIPNGGDPGIRLFVVNGTSPVAWRIGNDLTTLRMIEGPGLFLPLFPELVFSPFELQMPFIFWEDYIYEGISKLKGRRVHKFLMMPSLAIQSANPDLEAVRIAIDAKFKALIKVEILGPSRKSLKTFKIVSLKKIQNQVIIKRIDLLDEISRDKTRFTVNGAALDLDIEDTFFRPETLLEEVLPRSSSRFEYF